MSYDHCEVCENSGIGNDCPGFDLVAEGRRAAARELRRVADEFMNEYGTREQARARREQKTGRQDWTGQHFNSAIGQAADVLLARAVELDAAGVEPEGVR